MTDTLSFADRARARAAGAAAFANVLRKASVQREIDDAIRFANFGYDPDVEFVWKIVEPKVQIVKREIVLP